MNGRQNVPLDLRKFEIPPSGEFIVSVLKTFIYIFIYFQCLVLP